MHDQPYPPGRRLKKSLILLRECVFQRRGRLEYPLAFTADIQSSRQQGADSKFLSDSSQHLWIPVCVACRIDLTCLENLDEPTTIGNRYPIQAKLDLMFRHGGIA